MSKEIRLFSHLSCWNINILNNVLGTRISESHSKFLMLLDKSSPLVVFFKKVCPKKISNIHRKTLVTKSFFDKITGAQPATLL